MVRSTARNAFATAKALGLVDEKSTMWEFQWDILKQRYFGGAVFNNTTPTAAVPTVHAQKRFASRLLCTHCRNGTARWACGACGKHMHIKGFGEAHDVWSVMGVVGRNETVKALEAFAIPTHGTSANPGGTTA